MMINRRFYGIASLAISIFATMAAAEGVPRVVVIPLIEDRTGDAEERDVISGVTFSNRGATGLTGTMPDNGAIDVTPGTTAQSIPEGYHDGTGAVSGDLDLTAGNIKSGVEVFGVTGTVVEAAGDAVAGSVLSGAIFSNASAAGLIGTMPDNGAVNLIPGTLAQAIAQGYHNGSGAVAGDADLIAGNIKNGVVIFGTTGTVVEATGDAAASQVLSGQTFSNSTGSGLTGTIPDKEGDNASASQVLEAGVVELTAPIGFYDGDDTVTATEAQIAALEANLVSKNIKEGTTIFGVSGNWGYFSLPSPRFTDNGDGTITDNLTRVVWMKTIDCFSSTYLIENLYDGSPWAPNCDLSDGSVSGDWRDPKIKEIVSLTDFSQSPRLPVGHPFTNAGNNWIRSSDLRYTGGPALWFDLGYGLIDYAPTVGGLHRWPVRSEH